MNVQLLEAPQAAESWPQAASAAPQPQAAPRAPAEDARLAAVGVSARHQAQGLVTLPADVTLTEADALLRGAGYRPGFPAQLSRRTQALDLGLHRSCKCPECCSGGPHTVQPWHRGPYYLVVVRCVTCNAIWEG